MPRGPRLDFTGALHHVIVRGIERRRIFRGDADRQLFLNRLAAWLIDSRAGLYAWALMPNHAHLLLRTGQLPLSCLMQAWLSAYSTTFNRRHRRSGHLFQNRFKSTLVEAEPYLRQPLLGSGMLLSPFQKRPRSRSSHSPLRPQSTYPSLLVFHRGQRGVLASASTTAYLPRRSVLPWPSSFRSPHRSPLRPYSGSSRATWYA